MLITTLKHAATHLENTKCINLVLTTNLSVFYSRVYKIQIIHASEQDQISLA